MLWQIVMQCHSAVEKSMGKNCQKTILLYKENIDNLCFMFCFFMLFRCVQRWIHKTSYDQRTSFKVCNFFILSLEILSIRILFNFLETGKEIGHEISSAY